MIFRGNIQYISAYCYFCDLFLLYQLSNISVLIFKLPPLPGSFLDIFKRQGFSVFHSHSIIIFGNRFQLIISSVMLFNYLFWFLILRKDSWRVSIIAHKIRDKNLLYGLCAHISPQNMETLTIRNSQLIIEAMLAFY